MSLNDLDDSVMVVLQSAFVLAGTKPIDRELLRKQFYLANKRCLIDTGIIISNYMDYCLNGIWFFRSGNMVTLKVNPNDYLLSDYLVEILTDIKNQPVDPTIVVKDFCYKHIPEVLTEAGVSKEVQAYQRRQNDYHRQMNRLLKKPFIIGAKLEPLPPRPTTFLGQTLEPWIDPNDIACYDDRSDEEHIEDIEDIEAHNKWAAYGNGWYAHLTRPDAIKWNAKIFMNGDESYMYKEANTMAELEEIATEAIDKFFERQSKVAEEKYRKMSKNYLDWKSWRSES